MASFSNGLFVYEHLTLVCASARLTKREHTIFFFISRLVGQCVHICRRKRANRKGVCIVIMWQNKISCAILNRKRKPLSECQTRNYCWKLVRNDISSFLCFFNYFIDKIYLESKQNTQFENALSFTRFATVYKMKQIINIKQWVENWVPCLMLRTKTRFMLIILSE